MLQPYDPYGELEYGDWEDPVNHMLITMCDGCPMCVTWPGKTHDQIRSERLALIARRRAARPTDPSPAEAGTEDRAYWTDRYAG